MSSISPPGGAIQAPPCQPSSPRERIGTSVLLISSVANLMFCTFMKLDLKVVRVALLAMGLIYLVVSGMVAGIAMERNRPATTLTALAASMAVGSAAIIVLVARATSYL